MNTPRMERLDAASPTGGSSQPSGPPGRPSPGEPSANLSVGPGRTGFAAEGTPDKDRLGVAFDAILGLAGCVDQMIRELRRGVAAARWREVQDEVTRVRRLVMARPEPKEGPPRDEGPASQPPPPPV